MFYLIKSVLAFVLVGLVTRLAFVSKGLFLRVRVADLTGSVTTLRYQINTGHPDLTNLVTLAGANGQTTIDDVIATLDAVTKGKVVGYSQGEEYADDGSAFGTGDKDDKAVCTADIDGIVGKTATFKIPAPADTIFINDAAAGPLAETLDAADADLLAYAKMFQATELTVDSQGACLISDGEQLADDPVVRGRKI